MPGSRLSGQLGTVYDGQYLIIEARPSEAGRAERPRPEVERIGRLADAFGTAAERSIAAADSRLHELAQNGPLLLWQAGSKAVALALSIRSPGDVAALVDANPGSTARS